MYSPGLPGKTTVQSPTKLDIIRDLDMIGTVPTIELTEDQAMKLVETTALLQEKYSKYGMLKLRLPKNLKV